MAESKHTMDLLEGHDEMVRQVNRPVTNVPPIRDIIAAAIDRIGTYADLDNKQQVVAMIDEVGFCE